MPGLRWCRAHLQLGDRHLGGFDEGDYFTAHLQVQFAHRTGGDHRGDDARCGLHVNLRQHVAEDDFLDVALNWLRTLMALMCMVLRLYVLSSPDAIRG